MQRCPSAWLVTTTLAWATRVRAQAREPSVYDTQVATCAVATVAGSSITAVTQTDLNAIEVTYTGFTGQCVCSCILCAYLFGADVAT